MDLIEFNQTYGKRATEELLDILLIKQYKMNMGDWRMFCLRHNIIKKTTLTVIDRYPTKYQEYNQTHYVTLKNGRGVDVLRLQFPHQQIQEI